MSIRVVSDSRQVTDSINRFPSDYHRDFTTVRSLGHRYLVEALPTEQAAADLVCELCAALRNWGTGERKAPALRSLDECLRTLQRPEVHACLAAVEGMPIPSLGVANGCRTLRGERATREELDGFDSNLFRALHFLADGLFDRNTNATYPMKALLLITGFIPAFDSQVRRGLQRSGALGMKKNQYLLPADATRADGQKLANLPFLLGECWQACAPQLGEGIANSRFPELACEPGRVFDVLLFMQGNLSNPVLVVSDFPEKRWYALA